MPGEIFRRVKPLNVTGLETHVLRDYNLAIENFENAETRKSRKEYLSKMMLVLRSSRPSRDENQANLWAESIIKAYRHLGGAMEAYLNEYQQPISENPNRIVQEF